MTRIKYYPAKIVDLEIVNELITDHNTGDNLSYKPYHLSVDDIVETDRNVVYLSKVNDRLAGYLWIYSDQAFNNCNCDAKIIVVVAPTFRTSGIGENLISFVIEYAKKNTSIDKLIAEIKYDNIASKRLFKKFNFNLEHENGFGSTMVLSLKR